MIEKPEPQHNESLLMHEHGKGSSEESHPLHLDRPPMDQEELLKMLLRNEIEEGM